MSCPPDCVQDRKYFHEQIKDLFSRTLSPFGLRLLLVAVASLFGMYGTLWLYASTNFATKEEVKELRQVLPAMDRKLDRLLIQQQLAKTPAQD